MPVSTEKIKERLKKLFPGLNLSQQRMDEIADRLAKKPADDASDSDVDQVINQANEFYPFQEIAKSDDRVREAEAKAKKEKTKSPEELAAEAEAKKKADEKAAEEKKKLEEAPEWAKSFMSSVTDKMEGITKEIDSIKTGNVQGQKKTQVADLFAKSEVLKDMKDDIRTSWIGRVNLDSETSLEDQVKSLESEYQTLVQNQNDSKEFSGAPPHRSFSKTQATDKELESLVDEL